MIVALRTDASLEIGTGHVMRCLTLAHALRVSGQTCLFITRDLPGHLADRIRREGFNVILLPAPQGPIPEVPPEHAIWARVCWAQDARETGEALDGMKIDWLVVDHYAFDERWQNTARPIGAKLMVIDDLADRPHACDLLLDQNLGRKPSDYDEIVPADAICLTGPTFALLRPEFAALRAQALADRAGRGLKHLLITMGGVDARDATSAVLKALRDAPLPRDLDITIVMGSNAPALMRVRALAATMPQPTQVVVDVPDMAARMASADLAIGAGGGTTWERCCLGLPSVIVQIADNQAGISQALTTAGAALDPGSLQAPNFARGLRISLAEASNDNRLANLSENAAAICDGVGCQRAIQHLTQYTIGGRVVS